MYSYLFLHILNNPKTLSKVSIFLDHYRKYFYTHIFHFLLHNSIIRFNHKLSKYLSYYMWYNRQVYFHKVYTNRLKWICQDCMLCMFMYQNNYCSFMNKLNMRGFVDWNISCWGIMRILSFGLSRHLGWWWYHLHFKRKPDFFLID